MKNKYTHTLISKFFEKNISEELQIKFQKWFIESEAHYEKREAMLHIWDKLSSISDVSTSIALKNTRKRISSYESHKKKSLYKRVGWAAATVLLPILCITVVYLSKEETILINESELVEHFTPYKERKRIILPDSSEVWLNAGSLLVHAKAFEGETRTVFLCGEANFTVMKNANKPFIVKTTEVDIEVLGTIFNIESYADREYSITTLEEGKVKVNAKSTNAEPIYLSPNEQLIYNKTSKTFEKKAVPAAKESLWKQGYLVFQGSSFADMMKTIERQFGVKVNYNENLFKGRTFTTRFTPEENIDQIFDILKDICGFNYTIKDNTIYITN